MRKIIIISIVCLLSCKHYQKSQSNKRNSKISSEGSRVSQKYFRGDTVGYLQQFILDKKSKYIGKPLDTLLNYLELEVKSFMYQCPFQNKHVTNTLRLSFYSFQETINRGAQDKKPADLIIIWQNPMPSSESHDIFMKSAEWSDEAREYYGKQEVKNIFTTKYSK